MEFFYDHKTSTWTHTPNADKRFAIHLYGVTVPMGDFYEKLKEYRPNINHLNVQFAGFIPIVTSENDKQDPESYFCLHTNTWQYLYTDAKDLYNDQFPSILQYIVPSLHNRLEKLEGLFDTIRQRSSIIDEFIKIGEHVITKNESP